MVKQKQFLQKPICIILYFTTNWIPVIEKKREREYLKKVKIFVMIKFPEIVLVNNDKYYIQMYL